MSRESIRSSVLKKRRELSTDIQQKAAEALVEVVEQEPWFQVAQHIAFYAAVRGEMDPRCLLKRAWERGKTCYLPALLPNHDQLLFLPYFPNDPLTVNRYGISEPLLSKREPCQLDILEVVFTPLVAFDDAGNRLGSGKGYYDKTFAHAPDTLKMVGLAYDFQRVSELPVESWDVPLDEVIVFDIPCKPLFPEKKN